MKNSNIAIIGSGINGLVAANYLQRNGCKVTLIERKTTVGGACVSELMSFGGTQQKYALGASVLGLMQKFVYEETGLSTVLQSFAPDHPKIIYFPGDIEPTLIYRDPSQLDQEFSKKWGETGDVEAFRVDEGRVIKFLQDGYKAARTPTLSDARNNLGETLTKLWITGDAKSLLDHYFTSERAKIYMAMNVSESGPVSLSDPYSAFTMPLMSSGSVFDGYYGFIKGGIWKITEKLKDINQALGVQTHLSSEVVSIDLKNNLLIYKNGNRDKKLGFDFLIFGTDPLTANKLLGNANQTEEIKNTRVRGSSGKLNMMFKNPIRWKYESKYENPDSAFRFLFSVDSLQEFERATLKVLDVDVDYEPGYVQIYCEGAAMRHMNHIEPFDRLAIFFKNLSLNKEGDDLPHIESQLKEYVFRYIENPEDCVWTRLLTPMNLKNLFYFPGGNLDHTMLTEGQTYFDRTFSSDPENNFYRFGELENVYLCGAGVYPCGSVTGTPGYMCSQQLLRKMNGSS